MDAFQKGIRQKTTDVTSPLASLEKWSLQYIRGSTSQPEGWNRFGEYLNKNPQAMGSGFRHGWVHHIYIYIYIIYGYLGSSHLVSGQ